MKCLKRNKLKFYYSLFQNKTPIVDSNGRKTGEYTVGYSEPIYLEANVSSAMGETQVEQFGTDLQYDKVIVTDNTSLKIDENTVLFVDVPPQFDTDGRPLYDYIVKKVAKSLNSISYAISKVKVS